MVVLLQANLTDGVMSELTVTGRIVFRSREYEACSRPRGVNRLQVLTRLDVSH